MIVKSSFCVAAREKIERKRKKVNDRKEKKMSVTDALAKFLSKSTSSEVVVFTIPTCPFCWKVKWWLWWQGIPYRGYSLGSLTEGADIRAEVLKKYKHETVPIIFVGQTFVGGCDDTLALSSTKPSLWEQMKKK